MHSDPLQQLSQQQPKQEQLHVAAASNALPWLWSCSMHANAFSSHSATAGPQPPLLLPLLPLLLLCSSPNVLSMASSLKGESSYSYLTDMAAAAAAVAAAALQLPQRSVHGFKPERREQLLVSY
jgi:hypothetical protein